MELHKPNPTYLCMPGTEGHVRPVSHPIKKPMAQNSSCPRRCHLYHDVLVRARPKRARASAAQAPARRGGPGPPSAKFMR